MYKRTYNKQKSFCFQVTCASVQITSSTRTYTYDIEAPTYIAIRVVR